MKNFWHITGDFQKIRSNKIGASDIPALITNPEKPNESLAGYGRTPLTVWQEKTGKLKREPPGLPAEMGHYMENKAIELFLRYFEFPRRELILLQLKILAEMDNTYLDKLSCKDHCFKYHTQYYTENKIAHPDAIYIPEDYYEKEKKLKYEGITIDLTKPFIFEAKSARFFSAKRPEGSIVSGYDFKLKTWHGIALKSYFQIQYQLALFDIDVAYLGLISDTSDFHVWEIKANKEHQKELMNIADVMTMHIKQDTPPKELVINQADIKMLYPHMKDDFITLSGEKYETAKIIVDEFKKAKDQEKKWKEKKLEALDSMSVILQDYKELRDSSGVMAAWQTRKGRESVSITDMKKNDLLYYDQLKKDGYIKQGADSRSVVIK